MARDAGSMLGMLGVCGEGRRAGGGKSQRVGRGVGGGEDMGEIVILVMLYGGRREVCLSAVLVVLRYQDMGVCTWRLIVANARYLHFTSAALARCCL